MKRLLTLAVGLIFAAGCGTIPTALPAPHKPDGPKALAVGQKGEYKTEGTDPLDVHEFAWDWGDGEVDDWDADGEKAKHVFKKPGIFPVRVREQCPILKDALRSPWSDPRKVTVTSPTAEKVPLLKRLFR